jgi:hypothetical protein
MRLPARRPAGGNSRVVTRRAECVINPAGRRFDSPRADFWPRQLSLALSRQALLGEGTPGGTEDVAIAGLRSAKLDRGHSQQLPPKRRRQWLGQNTNLPQLIVIQGKRNHRPVRFATLRRC